MKALFILACMLCAASLSLLAAIYATGRLNIKTEQPEEPTQFPVWRTSVFPEQSRAAEDLLEEISARQTQLDRQKEQLDTREARIRQEEIVLQRMRDELVAAEAALNEHFNSMDATEEVNTRKLAEFYAKMDPENAARLLSEIENAQAARILSKLGDRQAGNIMNAAVNMGDDGIDRAVAWSDLIRMQKNEKKDTTQTNE